MPGGISSRLGTAREAFRYFGSIRIKPTEGLLLDVPAEVRKAEGVGVPRMFFAHSTARKDRSDWQMLPDHLIAVAALAAERGEKFGAQLLIAIFPASA